MSDDAIYSQEGASSRRFHQAGHTYEFVTGEQGRSFSNPALRGQGNAGAPASTRYVIYVRNVKYGKPSRSVAKQRIQK